MSLFPFVLFCFVRFVAFVCCLRLLVWGRAGVDDVVDKTYSDRDTLYHEAIVFRLRRNECRRAAKKYKGLPVEERASAGFGVPRPGEEREWGLC